MGLYRRGKIWWLNFVERGRRISTSTRQTDRRLAEKWAASYRSEVQHRRLDPFLPPQEIFLSTVLARYLRLHVRVNRPASYERCWYIAKHLRAFFWNTPVSRVRARMDEYKAWRKRTVETSTVNREITILKAALSKAVEYGLLSDVCFR